MALLVTGATGRTSAGVVRHLRAAGEDVRVLVRDSDKGPSRLSRTWTALRSSPVPSTTKPFWPRHSTAWTSPSWPWLVAPTRSDWRTP